jgi:hypothetical protein
MHESADWIHLAEIRTVVGPSLVFGALGKVATRRSGRNNRLLSFDTKRTA